MSFTMGEININNQINRIIAELNITVNFFASKLGMKATSIYNITNGKNKPSYDLLDKIIKTYNINPTWLFKDIGEIFLLNAPNSDIKNSELMHNSDAKNMHNQDIISENTEIIDKIYSLDGKPLPNYSYEYFIITHYERMSLTRLKSVQKIAKNELKDSYETREKLTIVMHELYREDWLYEKFPPLDKWRDYYTEFERDWREDIESSNSEKINLILLIMRLKDHVEHEVFLLNKLIYYMYGYKDFAISNQEKENKKLNL